MSAMQKVLTAFDGPVSGRSFHDERMDGQRKLRWRDRRAGEGPVRVARDFSQRSNNRPASGLSLQVRPSPTVMLKDDMQVSFTQISAAEILDAIFVKGAECCPY